MKAKKVLAMLMASAMIMGTSVTAFAEDINITTDHTSDTFQYLQVIKADTTEASGWAFASDAIAKEYSDAWGYTDSEEVDDMPTEEEQRTIIWQLIKKENLDVTIQGMPEDTQAAEDRNIAAALANVENGGYPLSSEQSAKFNVPAAGVYYIKGLDKDPSDGTDIYSPMAAYVGLKYNADGTVDTTQKEEENLTAKKAPGKPDKEAEDTDKVVAVSDVKTYTITSKVPYISSDKTINRYYSMTDTLTGGDYEVETEGTHAGELKVSVKVGDADPVDRYVTVTKDDESDNDTFTLPLDDLVADITNPNAYKSIVISYNVRVTGVEVYNNVEMNGADNESKPQYGGDSEILYTAKIKLIKYASDNNNNDLSDNKPLANAKFSVYRYQEDSTTKEYIKESIDNSTGKRTLTWVTNIAESTPFTTNGNGEIEVEGLDVGTYYFQETEAPAGYSLNKTDESVTVTQTGEATAIVTADPATMLDTKLADLPSTGGIGTTIFTIGGCAIMVTAAGLYFATRKKTEK